MSSSQKQYLLGTDEKQEWMQDYYYAPRGMGFLEPGIVGPDSARIAGMNVAKSFYQTRPDVFNIKAIAEKTGLEPEDIKKRLKRMYDDRIIMLVKNSAVGVYGFGLWYWVVKLKEDTPKEERQRITDWIQNNNEICTGYACKSGDFDYYCGNHMRVLDNLLEGVIDPLKKDPWVESIHLCPVRRDLRESQVNQFDIKEEPFRQYHLSDSAKRKLLKRTDLVDEADLAIIDALNNMETMADQYDYDVLEELSGLDGETMKKDMYEVMDQGRFMIQMIYLNFMKLGLNNHAFLVRFFQNTPSWRKAQIMDELSREEDFTNIFEFTDSYHDGIFMAYEELADIPALKEKIASYPEVEEIKEAVIDRQFRRWTARLDDEADQWEECVFTDDVLQNRMDDGYAVCPLCESQEAAK